MLIGCLLGAASLGCGKSSVPQASKDVPANPNKLEESADLRGEPDPHYRPAVPRDFGTGPEVRLDAITLTAPTTWTRTKPRSSYYLAEFVLPHVDKDTADGRLMVSVGSGPVEENIDVFMGEFDTASEHVKREEREIAGSQIRFVDVSGSYTGRHGQNAPVPTQPDYRMILAVIPIGDDLHFVKAVGPQKTIAANVGPIHAFVRSVQRRNTGTEVSEDAPGGGREIHLKPLTFMAPATWQRTKPRSSLVQAEFVIPHVDKDAADGRVTLSVVAGTVKDNVDRWKGQFVGAIDSLTQEEIETGGLKATLVDFTGEFGEQAGMMAPVVNRPNYRMIAAILPIRDQLYVIKAVGPKQTMAANVETIRSFLGSLKRESLATDSEGRPSRD
jgi:hypothetical protein